MRSDASGAARGAVDAALDWLLGAQHPVGTLPSYASGLEGPEPEWVADDLTFITALALIELHGVSDPRARAIVDAGATFLRGQRDGNGLWRYWSTDNPQWSFTPPDSDVTACCSLAVMCRGDDPTSNIPLILLTSDRDGRFYTWMMPHQAVRSPRAWWAYRDERKAATKELRQLLWETTEADQDDVDAVVNANVCRYLGPRRSPAAVVEWVASVVEAGRETHDKWYRTPYMLWAAVADGAERGIGRWRELAPTVLAHLAEDVRPDAPPLRSLDLALALRAAQGFDAPAELRSTLVESLVAAQDPTGAWPREVFYFGGPLERYGWASEALTTALAVRGLDEEISGDLP